MTKKDDDSDVDDDFVDVPDTNKGDEKLDGKESDNKDYEGSITVNDFWGKSFDIGQTINLVSKDLADMLAEKDLLPWKAVIKIT